MGKGNYQYKQVTQHQPNFVRNAKKYKRIRKPKHDPSRIYFKNGTSIDRFTLIMCTIAIIIQIVAIIYKAAMGTL